MARDNPISRRTAMKVTGAAAATALVAGCSDDGGDDSGNGDENGGEGGATEIEPGTDIELRSLGTSWEGIAPSAIEDEENPSLSLVNGEEYTIVWAENETGEHNLAVYDDSESPVAGPTDQTDEDEPGLEVTFEASEETVEYVCEPHYSAGMAGDIEVRDGNGGENETENGGENETENESEE